MAHRLRPPRRTYRSSERLLVQLAVDVRVRKLHAGALDQGLHRERVGGPRHPPADDQRAEPAARRLESQLETAFRNRRRSPRVSLPRRRGAGRRSIRPAAIVVRGIVGNRIVVVDLDRRPFAPACSHIPNVVAPLSTGAEELISSGETLRAMVITRAVIAENVRSRPCPPNAIAGSTSPPQSTARNRRCRARRWDIRKERDRAWGHRQMQTGAAIGASDSVRRHGPAAVWTTAGASRKPGIRLRPEDRKRPVSVS